MKLFGVPIFKNKVQELKDLSDKLKSEIDLLKQASDRKGEILEQIDIERKDMEEQRNSINRLKKEQSEGNPYLAKVISDFFYYRDIKTAEFLENKRHPAIKASSDVRKYAQENRELRRKFQITYRRIKLYENIFPFITDLDPDDIDFLLEQKIEKKSIEINDDPVKEYVPEYDKLTEEERNQRALKRYIKKRNRSKWEIGKMYERYIGYLYEKEGYSVDYIGIEKGFDDLGRDLICTKGEKTLVVQCKYWASYKEIKEAHINQLYGTTVKHFIDKFKKRSEKFKNTLFPDLFLKDEINIKAIFVTSTKLSETAMDFADALGIEVIAEKPMEYTYPMIKCNLNSQTGEKIYHLPIDQQYDRILMQNEERIYVKTVKEAMKLGCRRAYRWKPNKDK